MDAAVQKKQEKKENLKSCFRLLPACQNVCTSWVSPYPEGSSGSSTTWDNARAGMLQHRAWSIPGAALVSGQELAPEDALSTTNNNALWVQMPQGIFLWWKCCHVPYMLFLQQSNRVCSPARNADPKHHLQAQPGCPQVAVSPMCLVPVHPTPSPAVGYRGKDISTWTAVTPLLQHKAGMVEDTGSCNDGA